MKPTGRFPWKVRAVTSPVPSIGLAMEGVFLCAHGCEQPRWNTRAMDARITEKSDLLEVGVLSLGYISLEPSATSGAQCDATDSLQTKCQPTGNREASRGPERVTSHLTLGRPSTRRPPPRVRAQGSNNEGPDSIRSCGLLIRTDAAAATDDCSSDRVKRKADRCQAISFHSVRTPASVVTAALLRRAAVPTRRSERLDDKPARGRLSANLPRNSHDRAEKARTFSVHDPWKKKELE